MHVEPHIAAQAAVEAYQAASRTAKALARVEEDPGPGRLLDAVSAADRAAELARRSMINVLAATDITSPEAATRAGVPCYFDPGRQTVRRIEAGRVI